MRQHRSGFIQDADFLRFDNEPFSFSISVSAFDEKEL